MFINIKILKIASQNCELKKLIFIIKGKILIILIIEIILNDGRKSRLPHRAIPCSLVWKSRLNIILCLQVLKWPLKIENSIKIEN